MNTKKKVFTMIVCIALVIITSVFGTIAYFTAEYEVTNTFTIGSVDISLDEAKVDKYGYPLDKNGNIVLNREDAERIKSNSYKLIPGSSYIKDPTVTVLENSKESYVRMLVVVNDVESLKLAFPKDKEINGVKVYENYYDDDVFLIHKLTSGYDEEKWLFESFSIKDEKNIYEYRYYKKVDGSNGNIELEPLFTSVNIPGIINKDELKHLDDIKLIVEGNAIQSKGFENEDQAWNNFK